MRPVSQCGTASPLSSVGSASPGRSSDAVPTIRTRNGRMPATVTLNLMKYIRRANDGL